MSCLFFLSRFSINDQAALALAAPALEADEEEEEAEGEEKEAEATGGARGAGAHEKREEVVEDEETTMCGAGWLADEGTNGGRRLGQQLVMGGGLGARSLAQPEAQVASGMAWWLTAWR